MKGDLPLATSIQVGSAVRRFLLRLLVLFFFVPVSMVGQNGAASSGSWSGMIVSSACNADEAFNESPECAKNLPGAKLALYDDTNRVMYGLEPQKAVSVHLGDTVTVRGILDGETIQVATIQPMSIGLAVGEKAPAFSVRDQFGQVQSLDSLKGRNGTVLLFFRSADW
jgi:hypothetical protein